jgi:hypothetical protein
MDNTSYLEVEGLRHSGRVMYSDALHYYLAGLGRQESKYKERRRGPNTLDALPREICVTYRSK